MSDNNTDSDPFNRANKETKVRISIEKDEDVSALREENMELARKLEQVVSIEFAKQCQQFGLDPSTTTPEELQAYKRIKKEKEVYGHEPPRGGDSAPLNAAQLGENLRVTKYKFDTKNQDVTALDYDNEEQMILALNEMKRQGNKSAVAALSELTKKFLKQGNFEFEYEGHGATLLLKPIEITDEMSEQVKQRVREINARRIANNTNWRQIS